MQEGLFILSQLYALNYKSEFYFNTITSEPSPKQDAFLSLLQMIYTYFPETDMKQCSCNYVPSMTKMLLAYFYSNSPFIGQRSVCVVCYVIYSTHLKKASRPICLATESFSAYCIGFLLLPNKFLELLPNRKFNTNKPSYTKW